MAKKDETGNCSKCCHTEEIANCKTEEERSRLRKICLSCIRGCNKCRYQRRTNQLSAYIAEVKDGNTKDSLSREEASIKSTYCRFCKNHAKGKPCREDCKKLARLATIALAKPVFSETIPNTKPKKPYTPEYAAEVIGRIQSEHCNRCTHCPSTDNMPSHGGKEFVYLESSEEPQTILDHADPFARTVTERDSRDFDTPELTEEEQLKRQQVTTDLPASVEERLLQELKTFVGSLDWIDRCLVFFLMQGGKLVDFGKMNWVPKEFVNGISNKPELTHRYKRIIKVMPIFKSIAHGMIGKGIGGAKKKDKSANPESNGKSDSTRISEEIPQYDLFGNRI